MRCDDVRFGLAHQRVTFASRCITWCNDEMQLPRRTLRPPRHSKRGNKNHSSAPSFLASYWPHKRHKGLIRGWQWVEPGSLQNTHVSVGYATTSTIAPSMGPMRSGSSRAFQRAVASGCRRAEPSQSRVVPFFALPRSSAICYVGISYPGTKTHHHSLIHLQGPRRQFACGDARDADLATVERCGILNVLAYSHVLTGCAAAA